MSIAYLDDQHYNEHEKTIPLGELVAMPSRKAPIALNDMHYAVDMFEYGNELISHLNLRGEQVDAIMLDVYVAMDDAAPPDQDQWGGFEVYHTIEVMKKEQRLRKDINVVFHSSLSEGEIHTLAVKWGMSREHARTLRCHQKGDSVEKLLALLFGSRPLT